MPNRRPRDLIPQVVIVFDIPQETFDANIANFVCYEKSQMTVEYCLNEIFFHAKIQTSCHPGYSLLATTSIWLVIIKEYVHLNMSNNHTSTW